MHRWHVMTGQSEAQYCRPSSRPSSPADLRTKSLVIVRHYQYPLRAHLLSHRPTEAGDETTEELRHLWTLTRNLAEHQEPAAPKHSGSETGQHLLIKTC